MEKILNQKGVLLLEILIAVAIGAIIIGAVAGLVYVSSKSGQLAGAKSAAVSLAEEGFEAMQSISETDWHNVYLPPTGSGNSSTDKGDTKPYYVYKSGSSWALGKVVVGNEGNVPVDGIIYTRNIYIYNVNRNIAGDREIVSNGGIEDPSTQKIKAVVSKGGSADVVLEEYVTRWKNDIYGQSNWFGGSGQADFIDPSMYDSDDLNIDVSTPGSIKLKQ